MPDLNQLGLDAESTPQVDWDAPESGSYPPVCKPGLYKGIFRMPEKKDDWFDVVEVETEKGQPKKKFLVICYEAELLADGKDNPIPPGEDGKQPVLRFQRASFYKHPKMMISQGAELLRSIGCRITGELTPQAIASAIEQYDGKVRFEFEVGWRAYFKTTETTISTFPRRKRGDLPWPKKADGSFEEVAVHPQTGEKMFPNADIIKVKLPHAA